MPMVEQSGRLHPSFEGRKHEFLSYLLNFASPRIVFAMEQIPRECFVPKEYLKWAYADRPVPLRGYEGKATITSPKVIAIMTQLLDPRPSDHVLEIGTATGYQAALLGKLSERVVTVEAIPALAHTAKQLLRQLDINNVDVVIGDGGEMFTIPGAFDKILVTASVVPARSDQDQLVAPLSSFHYALQDGGLCIAPIGGVKGVSSACDLVIFRKDNNSFTIMDRLPGFHFVPMEGAYGWSSYLTAIIPAIIQASHEGFFGREDVAPV